MNTTTVASRVKAGFRVMTGCIPIPAPYRPSVLGQVKPPVAENGLELTIQPVSAAKSDEDRVVFEVTFRNVGSEAVVLPREPWVQFVWTYANGKRNDVVYNGPSGHPNGPGETVALEPGRSMQQKVTLITGSFRYRGLTEFRAVFRMGPNPGSATPAVWQGSAVSNAVGVMVDAVDEEDNWAWSLGSQHGFLVAEGRGWVSRLGTH